MNLAFLFKRCISPSRTTHSLTASNFPELYSVIVTYFGMGTLLFMGQINRRFSKDLLESLASAFFNILFFTGLFAVFCYLAYSALLRLTTKWLGFTETYQTFRNIYGMSSWVPLALLFPIYSLIFILAGGHSVEGTPLAFLGMLLSLIVLISSVWGFVILLRTHQTLTGFSGGRSLAAIFGAVGIFIIPQIALISIFLIRI